MLTKQSLIFFLLLTILTSTYSQANLLAEATSSEEENWSDDYSPENSCPSDKFWHIRGRRCVPFKCFKSNSLRDPKTGLCLYQEDSARNQIPFTDWDLKTWMRNHKFLKFCQPGKTWPAKGSRCLPIKCPYGSVIKDLQTGLCRYESDYPERQIPQPQSRPMRTPIGSGNNRQITAYGGLRGRKMVG